MKTFAQLKSEIRQLVWADQEPENLVAQHDEHFQEALSHISENVACEREGNVNIIDFCKTFSKCGMTIVPEPAGLVRRVFTLVKESDTGEDWCDPVYYDEVDWPMPEFFGKRAMVRMHALPSFPKTLDLGFHPSDASQDSPCGRARVGMWCKHGGNIYISPWIQSVERVCVEYDGIKTRWEDADPVNDTPLYRKTIMLYWHYLHEYWFGERKESAMIHDVTTQSGRGTFDRALADLMYHCENQKKVRETKHDSTWQYRCLLTPVIELSGKPLVSPGPLILAHIGNFVNGNCSPVANLINNHAPMAILGSGVNVRPELGMEYDQLVGSNYHGYIFPYYGDFGSGADKNRFWPAIGDFDWADSLEQFHAFFATPKNHNYYDVCLGPVHVFVIDSSVFEPDGITNDSAQAQWLKAKMTLSPAPWKVVVCDSLPDPIWDFKAWGASLVLTGRHYYERRVVSGLTVITNGCGGGPKNPPGVPPPGIAFSSILYDGAGIIVATKCSLTYSFYNTADNVVDVVAFHKPPDCVDADSAAASTLTGGASDAAAVICKHRVYQNAGNPNGVVMVDTDERCYCSDTVNNILWVKDDGVISNTGWA